jgi:hypothetical protein
MALYKIGRIYKKTTLEYSIEIQDKKAFLRYNYRRIVDVDYNSKCWANEEQKDSIRYNPRLESICRQNTVNYKRQRRKL